MKLTHVVSHETTVKHILKNELNVSSNLLKKLKKNNGILSNGQPVRVVDNLCKGDFVTVDIGMPEMQEGILPDEIPLDVLYEDDGLIAINKQPNIVVHPSIHHKRGTLANALVHYYNLKNIRTKIRPVSRLDRDTSGVILFAKNQYFQDRLISQMKDKTFVKEYYGLVKGLPFPDRGMISFPIARKEGSIIERTIDPEGSPSITHYETIRILGNMSLLRFRLETGRTHQIRVHCLAIGHPLIGDTLYNDISSRNHFENDSYKISRQALHAYRIEFSHPITFQKIEITAPLPADILSLMEISSD